MIKVDILSPIGGMQGGIENVIKMWSDNIGRNPEYDLRIIHLEPGTKYLDGYEKAYAFKANPEDKRGKFGLEEDAKKYFAFILEYGTPDICIASIWPLTSVVAEIVRENLYKKKGESFKIVSWMHNRVDEYEKANLGGFSELQYADYHLAINDNTRREFNLYNPGKKVYVLGNPIAVDTEEDIVKNSYEENQKSSQEDNKENKQLNNYENKNRQLLYVGRLEYIKRVDIILEAMYRAKSPWAIKIIGDGDERKELEEIVKFLKMEDRVEFLGWQENPWKFAKGVTALVAASEYEGFMLTGAEALEKGIMVISTPVYGVVDYVKEGYNGYFFPMEGAIELAQILDDIYYGKKDVFDSSICKKSVEKYSVSNYFKRVDEMLKEIANLDS